MVDQSLVDYVKENLRKGYSIESLKKTMLDHGWDPGEVDHAIVIARSPSQPPSRPAPHPQQAQPYPPPQFQPQDQTQPPAQPGGAQPAQKAANQQPPSGQQAGPPHRPTGVTVICVLGFVLAILMILSGILSLGLSGLLGLVFDEAIIPIDLGNQTMMEDLGTLGSILRLMGLFYIVIGIVDLVGFYLLLNMKRIGWIIIIIMRVLSIITGIINLLGFSVTSVLAIVISAVIVVYLLIKRELFVY